MSQGEKTQFIDLISNTTEETMIDQSPSEEISIKKKQENSCGKKVVTP
jgi:hypothetical protein